MSLLFGCALALVTAGCGGGGGGGNDFVGAALVAISASPTRIDTGDRIMVRTQIAEVNDNGIALKFRIPSELSYVLDSSFMVVDGKRLDVSPTVDVAAGNSNFLVYYFAQDEFDDNRSGTLEFQVRANEELDDGKIEVDPDVDDPLIDNAEEFDPENPEFGAEDTVFIQVVN